MPTLVMKKVMAEEPACCADAAPGTANRKAAAAAIRKLALIIGFLRCYCSAARPGVHRGQRRR